jgi:hypothetical protein
VTVAELHELPFLAPVPRGHDVLVVSLRRTPDDPSLSRFVLDQTDGVLYCDEKLWGAFGRDVLATQNPLGVLTRWSWVVEKAATGRVAGVMISTKNWGDTNHSETRLFVEPMGAPYR